MDGSPHSDDDRPPSGHAGGAMVDVLDATGRLSKPDVNWLMDYGRRAMGQLGAGGSVAVRVVGDTVMSAAHEQFSGDQSTTDVLTFDLGTKGMDVDADILICLDEAERQGKARGLPARQELLLYIIHGVLHCLGHDDHDETGYQKMHAQEDRVLGLLGLGTTFAREERGGNS